MSAFSKLVILAMGLGNLLALTWSASTLAVFGWVDWVWWHCRHIFPDGPPNVYTWITAAFLFMGCSLLLQFVWRFLRTRNWVLCWKHSSNPPSNLQILRFTIQRGISVIVLDSASPVAFTYGWFRPRIYISEGLLQRLNPEELQAVLEHEAHHCKNRDPLRMLVSGALVSTFFFLPILQRWRDWSYLEQEWDADCYAVSRTGKRALVSALLKSMPEQSDRVPATIAVGQNDLSLGDLRIDALITGKRPSFRLKTQDVIISSGMITPILILIGNSWLTLQHLHL